MDNPSSPSPVIEDTAATRDHYARSTLGRPIEPRGVVYPTSLEEVRELVARAQREGLKLHPISRGLNWGYGDAAPPAPGQVVVDLSRMNRVLEVNEPLGYAVIEPGVTQAQLLAHLRERGLKLWPDATGAGLDSSLVGNTLDRGFGHTRVGDHFLNACGMEVVLADGRVLRTGFGHYGNAKAHRVYRYGVGPFLDGIFCQSNFGIVTKLGVWLMPEPEAFGAFFFMGKHESDLEAVVEALRPLRMAGLLQSTIHIANDLRVISARTQYPWDRAGGRTPLPTDVRAQLRREFGIGAWSGLGGIYGTRRSVAATRAEVAAALRRVKIRPVFIDDRRMAMAERLARVLGSTPPGRALRERLDIVKPVYGLLKGEPSDEPRRAVAWRVRGPIPADPADPRDLHAGLHWASPILPMTGEAARDVVNILEPIYERHGFEFFITFTMITERAMVAVTNMYFDTRERAEVEQADACYDEAVAALMERGYIPYRTGPRGYAKLARGSEVFWDVVGDLKQALDPNRIISPGRYEPGEPRRDA